MKPDYTRLLEAAKTLRDWIGPTEIAHQLTLSGYKVSEQMMTNWKSRGLPALAYARIPEIIGCDQNWLENGSGDMRPSKKPDQKLTQEENLLLNGYRTADETARDTMLWLAERALKGKQSSIAEKIAAIDPESLVSSEAIREKANAGRTL